MTLLQLEGYSVRRLSKPRASRKRRERRERTRRMKFGRHPEDEFRKV